MTPSQQNDIRKRTGSAEQALARRLRQVVCTTELLSACLSQASAPTRRQRLERRGGTATTNTLDSERDSHGGIDKLALDDDIGNATPVLLVQDDAVGERMRRRGSLDDGEPASPRRPAAAVRRWLRPRDRHGLLALTRSVRVALRRRRGIVLERGGEVVSGGLLSGREGRVSALRLLLGWLVACA